jgi:hypothetical protein
VVILPANNAPVADIDAAETIPDAITLPPVTLHSLPQTVHKFLDWH